MFIASRQRQQRFGVEHFDGRRRERRRDEPVVHFHPDDCSRLKDIFDPIVLLDDDPSALVQIARPIQHVAEGDTVVYCRIGERSSHTWFVLTYLLGHQKVRNYDGSWTEWGNRVRAPIEKGSLA